MNTNSPAREDLADNEITIRVTSPVDDLGRAQFTAFWLDAGVPGGVRGQVSRTSIAEFLRREQQQGFKVTALDEHTHKLIEQAVKEGVGR